MKINTQKKSSHNKNNDTNNCKSFYNTHYLNQTLNSIQFKYPQIKEINDNLRFSNSHFVFGNQTQYIINNGFLSLDNFKEHKYSHIKKDCIRRRMNTSYFVYPIENNRNPQSQNVKENQKDTKLSYHVQIPDIMKIPFLNKKNRLIKYQLKQLQNHQEIQQDDIKIASRISFHTKTKSNLTKKQNPNANQQLQIIVDEHQSSDLSFINGWE